MIRSRHLIPALVALVSLGPAALASTGDSTGGIGSKLSGFKQKFRDQEGPACTNQEDYNDQAKKKACQSCQAAITDLKSRLNKTIDDASTKDNTATGGFSLLSGIFGGAGGGQTSAFTGGQGLTSGASGTMNSRSGIGTDAQSQFQQCQKQIAQSCNQLGAADTKVLDSMVDNCKDAEKAAGQFASEQKSGGMGMDDISKLLGVAAQGAGAAAQLMQAMNQSATGTSSGISAPAMQTAAADTSASGTSGPQTSALANNSGASSAANGVGFGTAASQKEPAVAAGSGSGSSNGYAERPSGLAGEANGTGASSASPYSSGSAGGSAAAAGAGKDAKPAEGGGGGAAVAAAADGANPYEMGMGGGMRFGGGGGKGGKDTSLDGGDMAASLNDNGKSPLEDFGVRAPASATDAAAASDDVLANDEESIFLRVRQKYSLLKGSGRI